MKTITIYPPVEVFDDPEFCNNFNESPWKIDFCGHCIIDGSYPECGVFISDDGKIETLLEVGTRITKCQQCKDLYAKTKAKIVIGRYINHEDGSIEFLVEGGPLEIANDLSLKRAKFCKKMGPCPECKTEQVQLLGWPEKPYCKCRNCKHEWGKK